MCDQNVKNNCDVIFTTFVKTNLNPHCDEGERDAEGREDEHETSRHLVGHGHHDPVRHEQRDPDKNGRLEIIQEQF